MTDALTKTLLVEDVAPPRDVAEALHASVVRGVPLSRALVESGAVTAAWLDRYFARAEAPVLERVAPLADVARALPPGLCERLLVVPVSRDAETGGVDVAMVDAADAHAAAEIAFHLGAPVRVLRAPRAALEEALRSLATAASQTPDVASPAPEVAPGPAPRRAHLVVTDDDDERASRPVPAPAGAHSAPSPTATLATARRRSRDTPPWGTPAAKASAPSDAPKSSLGSEIPIPLTRRTFTAVTGGTQRPPPLVDPGASPLGEGYPIDPAGVRAVVEVHERAFAGAAAAAPSPPGDAAEEAPPSTARDGEPEPATLLAALRAAASRDEILDLLLDGAAQVARRVALFVVKRGGYVGWSCNADFTGDQRALAGLVLALDSDSIFDRAVQDELYLGPLPGGAVHAPLAAVMGYASPDVAVVPVRVLGKTAVIVLADELADTMTGTRHLHEVARAAGEAFARLVLRRP